MSGEALHIRGLSFSYPGAGRKTLSEINLDIEPGQLVVLCGPSGGGKTTLLRQLKPALAPHGLLAGEILLGDTPLEKLDQRRQSGEIGFVLQSPDEQLATDKVWHELAFGLESLGVPSGAIRRRVAEMAAFFGIQEWLNRSVDSLSGGQKQLVALASVMVMDPSVLLLDEPTSQLDPVAAAEFLSTVARLNRELGLTVLLTEHRLEEALPHADRAVVLDNGTIVADGKPGEVGRALLDGGHRMFLSMPSPMRIWAGAGGEGDCPLTVGEGRIWLDKLVEKRPLAPVPPHNYAQGGETALKVSEVWFRYTPESEDILKDLHVEIPSGTMFALMGGNGAGKSTAMAVIAGLLRPRRGRVEVFGRNLEDIPKGERYNGLLGVLPQAPQTLFVRKTVEEELWDVVEGFNLPESEKRERVEHAAELCEITHLKDSHPFDLSGGEQQRAALAKVLLQSPKILLLDEPTKGMDAAFKEKLADILKRLQMGGATIVMVSHDVEFCARYADRCALLFDGNVVSQGTPEEFFPGNSFYTTAAHRMSRHRLPQAVTVEDVVASCGGQTEEREWKPAVLPARAASVEEEIPPLPGWRKGLCVLFAVIAALAGWWTLQGDTAQISMQWRQVIGTLILCVSALLSMACVRWGRVPKHRIPDRPITPGGKITLLVVLILAPLTLWMGLALWNGDKLYFVALLLMLETALPFLVNFEKRKPKARELVLIAVLTAIAVAGRVAFFAVPQFKPLLAVVIVAGAALGCETGFLVGMASMLISNFYVGQSAYTPFQMFAVGLIGCLAGLLFRKTVKPGRVTMSAYGFFSALLIYGCILNSVVVLLSGTPPTLELFIASMVSGLPMDLVHGLSTAFFLCAIGPELLDKVVRIRKKYGFLSIK